MNRKTVLITGASSGIGAACAKVYAAAGYNLVLIARREHRLSELAISISSEQADLRVDIISKDLSMTHAIEEVFLELARLEISADILINNAGVGDFAEFKDAEWVRLKNIIKLNIESLTKLSYFYIKERLDRNLAGEIINIASTAAFQAIPLMGVYAASKAYVLSFSEALACELADSQIKVSCVCPGPTKTEFNMRADMGEFKLPANVLATAESVAEDCLRISQKQQSKVKINGFFNQITMFLSKFAPRKAKTRAARDMMRKVAG